MDDLDRLVQRKTDALPYRAALEDIQQQRLGLCEEALLMLWIRSPAVYGITVEEFIQGRLDELPSAAPLPPEWSTTALTRTFGQRVERSYSFVLNAYPDRRPWDQPTPAIRRLLEDSACAPARDPGSILRCLWRTRHSLLRRALGGTAALIWSGPGADDWHHALTVVSGPQAGTRRQVRDEPLRIGRLVGEGRSGPAVLLLNDRSISRLQTDQPAPLQLHCLAAGFRLNLRRGRLHWAQDLWDPTRSPSQEPLVWGRAASVQAPVVVDVAYSRSETVFRFGSTVFVLTPEASCYADELGRRVLGLQGSLSEAQLHDFLQLAVLSLESDPWNTLTKVRGVCEKLVRAAFERIVGSAPKDDRLDTMLRTPQFRQSLSEVHRTRLNMVREYGNLGAHLRRIRSGDARKGLEVLCDLLEDWWEPTYGAGPAA